MRSRARELCEEYGYPYELSTILEEVVGLALEHLGEITSIVLSPSVSTGDFLWTQGASGVHLLSDVDGFIYVEGPVLDFAGYATAVRSLTKRVGGSMFHIDLSVNPSSAIDRLPETYQFVETGKAGFVLYGESVLNRFPRRFDPRASRQAFLLNLFKPLREAFLVRDLESTAQAAARLMLDIATLAASESGLCIAGHRARAEWFLDDPPSDLGKDPVLRSAVRAAWDARRNPPGNVATLEPILHSAIPRIVSLLDGRGDFPLDPDSAAVERLASWLPPRTPRRWLGEARSVIARPTGRIDDLRWLMRCKEAVGGAALLGLFGYLATGLDGAPANGIRSRLREFARRECSDDDGLAFVRSACAVYVEGLVELYPAMRETT